jgi:hypothetical protein
MRYSPRFPHTFFTNPILTFISVVPILMCAAMMSCSSNNTSMSPPTSLTIGVDQFPTAIGTSWTYAVYDSVQNTLDTVSVKIENPISAERQFAGTWIFSGRNYHDTMYVQVEGNRVILFEDPFASQPDVTIEFPLTEGASWGKGVDTTVVYSETSVAVPAGSFDDAVRVDRHAVGFNYRLYSQRWIVPNIGIVRWDRDEFDLGPALRQRWVLMSYGHAQ